MVYSNLLLLLAAFAVTASGWLYGSQQSTTGVHAGEEASGPWLNGSMESGAAAKTQPFGSYAGEPTTGAKAEPQLAASGKRTSGGSLVPTAATCFLDTDCAEGSVCVIFDDDPEEAPRASHCEFVEIPSAAELL